MSPRRSTRRSLPSYALGVDLAVIVVTCGIAVLARGSLGVFDTESEVPTTLEYAGPLLVVSWLIALAAAGTYQRDVLGAGFDEFKRVVHASALTAAALGITCYLAKFDLSRGFFVLAFATGIPALLLGRISLRVTVHATRRHGRLLERVLIAGDPRHVDEIAAVLARESWLGYQVIGALTSDLEEFTPAGLPVVGHVGDVRGAVRELDPDVLFMADNSLGSSAGLRELVWDLESHDVQVVVAPSVADIAGDRVKVRPVGGLPLIHIEKPRTVQASRWAKRSFDVVGASALIFLFTPLLVLAALRIWSHDRGPVLYKQVRIGRGGAEFGCFKFRTMVQNADQLQRELCAARGESGLLFKLQDDPRVTRPGRWLRKYSFDELPQLFNVLRGHMSLVGPRPQVADEVALYEGHMGRRLLVRPGLTGLWQVSGRSDLSVQEAMRLDLFYVDNWSMLQDLTILARTLSAVLSSRGAY